MIGPEIEPLLTAAGWAPSGDNTQPWRFLVDTGSATIGLALDPRRDPSPMNAGQRMARIALGAALENLLRAAEGLGWRAELVADPRPPALAVVRLVGRDGPGAGLDPTLSARLTNRRPYDGRPVATGMIDLLKQATPDLEGVRTDWIIDPARLAALAGTIGRGDALMFGNPTLRRAFLVQVHLDNAPGVPVPEGFGPAPLELTRSDRLALRLMGRSPDWLLRLGGAGRVFARRARQLVASSSGLCLGTAPDSAEATDLAVGRALQRAWLALTAQGLSAQPMMSLVVLQNIQEQGDPALVAALGRDRLGALEAALRDQLPELAGARPAYLLRFGHALPPSGRTGRRPWQAVTTDLADASTPRGEEIP